MDTSQQAEINKWLLLTFGYGDPKKPLYRLVWGPNQFENRWGTFREFAGPIFLREFHGVKHLPKYQEHGNVYILEKFIKNYQPEILVGVAFSYEPIWVFDKKGKDGDILHPWLGAIQFLMIMCVEGPKMAATRMIREQGDSYDQEALMFADELEHEAPNKAYGGVGIL